MIPGQITLIPIFNFKNFGLAELIPGFDVPNIVNATFIFMMRQFFKFSHRMEEAAALDGLGSLETFFQIVLPLAKPHRSMSLCKLFR